MGDPPVQAHPIMLSENATARERQVADPFAGGGENRIAKRCYKWRHSRFSGTGGRRAILHNVDVGLRRDLVDSGDRIVIEIRLLNYAVLRSNLTAAHDARAKNHRAFELRARRFRIHDESRIYSCIN